MDVAHLTALFVVLALPVLGVLGRTLPFAALLGVIIVVLASDTPWHWLPWW